MGVARLGLWLPLPLLAAGAAAQREAGPLPVGFTRHWSLDPARTYDTTFADGTTYAGGGQAPRPILVNVWYPAAPAEDAALLRRGDYLDVTCADPRLAPFARALEAYARGVVADEVLEEPAAERDAEDEAALAAVLAAPAGAVRDAPPAGGRYPLVIYHAGYGSSYEDDAAFCERLAGHGYVVAGSAFEQADGASFNIDAHDGSLRDLDFLVRELAARADVDAALLALAGHRQARDLAHAVGSGRAAAAHRGSERKESARDRGAALRRACGGGRARVPASLGRNGALLP